MTLSPNGEQGTLPGLASPTGRPNGRRSRAAKPPDRSTEPVGIARIAVDVSVAHLDRLFDYVVPADLSQAAGPGVRVRVRFAGRDVLGYIIERDSASHHDGPLASIRRVVSPVPVLDPTVWRLVGEVADYYAGVRADVLRLAIPARHAATETAVWAATDQTDYIGAPGPTAVMGPDAVDPGAGPTSSLLLAQPSAPELVVWSQYQGGAAFVTHLAAGRSPRVAWTALPWDGPEARSPGWIAGLVAVIGATHRSGRDALAVLPDLRDVVRLTAALDQAGIGPVARLVAEDGPAARYRQFLLALTGQARVVVGTRAAAFAPLRRPGLLICWDDAAATHREPRAPCPHTREVLALRATLDHCGLLIGGLGRTEACQRLVASSWLKDISAARTMVRQSTPRVTAPSNDTIAQAGAEGVGRIPALAHRLIRQQLDSGPVLIHVPRAGYIQALACQRCRSAATCSACHGPLGLAAAAALPTCRWCGRTETNLSCPQCGGSAIRSLRIGSNRTAEELGRAFPDRLIRLSSARAPAGVLDQVDPEPAVVVATPGAEPYTPGGYAAAVLLDGAVLTASTRHDASTGALAAWLAACSLVRPAGQGGVALLLGQPAPGPAQALVRWEPVALAARELAERASLGLPPAVRMAQIEGEWNDIGRFVGSLDLPEGSQVLGPVRTAAVRLPGRELNDPARALVRVPHERARALPLALKAGAAAASARRDGANLRIRLDPDEIA